MTFAQFIYGIVGVINTVVIPIIFALTFLVFVWGIFRYYFLKSADEKERTNARAFVLWGLVGMILILSIWGLVNVALSTLGIG
ncbi:hypothetical protein HYV30_00400 [Candidatus Kaiserbacteria bacterium]|nr:hypothetical protein [Candidatus Kaiserbacteria bacterium]